MGILWTSPEHHFGVLEVPQGRPLGDFGSTLYSCEGVEVILGTFWNNFGFPKGAKICHNVCPRDLSTDALESS